MNAGINVSILTMHGNVVMGGQLDEHLLFWQPTISINLYVIALYLEKKITSAVCGHIALRFTSFNISTSSLLPESPTRDVIKFYDNRASLLLAVNILATQIHHY